MTSSYQSLTLDELNQKMRNSILLDSDGFRYRGFIIDNIHGNGFISEAEIDMFYDMMKNDVVFDLHSLLKG